jgi:hypothetical protein
LAGSDDPQRREDAELLLMACAECGKAIRNARKELERYQGVPQDADTVCRCKIDLKLPAQISEQLIDV